LIVGDKNQDLFFLYTSNPIFMHEFWANLPQGHKCFSAVPKQMALIFLQDKQIEWQSICQAYALKGIFEPIESPIYQVESLNLADAAEVDEYYTYRDDDSITGIRENIALKDSACIRIDGQLAAWCTVHAEDNSMGPLYTKEQYRGQGLAAIVASELIKKQLAKNIIPYVQIVESNNPSLSLIKKFPGIEYTHDCIWFGVNKK
jgi:GNAT superfamily N-acetyltransferase